MGPMNRFRHRGSTRLAAACALLIVAIWGCSRHGTQAPTGGSSTPPSQVNLRRNVELCQAEQRALVYNVETVGVIEAEGMTELAAGVKGVVDEVTFREGDEVSPDQAEPLVKVDQRSYIAAQKLADASVAKAQANVNLASDRLDRVTKAGQGSSAQERDEARLVLNAAI